MDTLERKVRWKIKAIVAKLEKLKCTLLGNKEDAWIMELLFEPGFHRYHLIEWMLSKLGYEIGKMSGPQNSPEERMKNLQSTLTVLGLCQQNSHDVIKGTAAVKEQLEFWCQLVEIIWLKYQITSNISETDTDDSASFSPKKNKSINEEFETACFGINKICETVNLKHLFEHNIQLLAPDVESEVKNISPTKPESLPSQNKSLSKIPNLEEFKENATMKNKKIKNLSEKLYKKLLSPVSVCENKNDSTSDMELNKLEEEIHKVSMEFRSTAESGFNDVYNDLKYFILRAKADKEKLEKTTDVGPAFKKLEPLLEKLLQLKKSFHELETSDSKLLKLNSDIDDLISQEPSVDESYANVLKLVKDEKEKNEDNLNNFM